MHVQAQLVPADPYALPTEGLRGVPKEVILYQYDVCPFCCKVKAVLDYYRVRLRPLHSMVSTHQSSTWQKRMCCWGNVADAVIPWRARYPTGVWRWARS